MPAHASPTEPAAHPTHALLLVSDDEALSRALSRVALPRGYRVVSAPGARCLELVHALQPDAIVLDLALPDAEPWVLLDRLKHDPRSRHVPVHLVGAEAQGHHALASGALGFLARPVADDALARALDDSASLVERSMRLLLVVEDDGGRREDIVAVVGGDGVEVTAVAGREALEAIARGRYDAMIVGLDQAGGGGLDLLEALSQRPELRRVPAVAYALDALPAEDEARLSRLGRSQVLRPARTPERLLDESTLLLHRAQASLPPAQRETLLRSLGAEQPAPAAGRATPSPRKPSRAKPSAGRRTGASLDATKEVLLAAITKEPGRRFEEIRLALGRDRADLQLPLRKLVAEGSVKSKGVKRATRYYPASR